MKKTITILLGSLFSIFTLAQNNTFTIPENYFQQEVNYNIEVTLDDVNHTLRGVADIEYINNSPDELEKIYFHLWANAHKNKHTAFAKQEVQLGNRKFHFSKKEDKGGYTEIDFQSNGKTMNWNYDKEHIDIVLIQLNEKLRPNQSIKIRIPFQLKIPKYFSRMGHIKQAYYMAQWYPKPAVYDHEGWHPMPYLSLEEFYSEFGKFDVKITLPENYVVAATGQLQTESEKIFLQQKIKETNEMIAKEYPDGIDKAERLFKPDPFPSSSSTMKTIRYTAENVHDFAWFTDKRFFVQKSQVQVGKNEQANNVDTWAFFTILEFHLWVKATKYLNQAVAHYSENVGAYPYPHATAVANPFANEGAMEYPMITLIDNAYTAKDLDMFVAHEVGHNWFYGILGFNERDYPWLDEGINTFYEKKYEKKFYPKNLGVNDGLPDIFRTKGELDGEELIEISMQRENMHQRISTPKHEWTNLNYNIATYAKTAKILNNRVTPEKMKSFFKKWKFKHPQPKDFIQHFELEEDKLFHDLLNTTKKVDYKIISVSKSDGYKLKIKNKDGAAFPFQLFMISGDKEKVKKIEGFEGTKTIHISKEEVENIDQFIIDKNREIPDVNRKNNNIRTSGVFKKMEPFQMKFLMGLENPTRTTLSWLPALGWNNYDKTMLGILFHNNDLGVRKVEFALAPMYAFASKQLVGVGQVKFNLFPASSPFQRVTLSLNAKRFNYDYNWENSFHYDYNKIAPQLEFVFKKKKMNSGIEHRVAFRNVNIFYTDRFKNGNNPSNNEKEKKRYYISELKYTFKNSKVTSPFEATLTAHQGQGFVKIFANARKFFPFRKSGKGIRLKGFAGILPKLEGETVAGILSLSGITSRLNHLDYMFDETLFGRTEGSADGIFSQQIFNRDAGLKTLSDGGTSKEWMVSLGVNTTLPWKKIPIRPYIDIAIFKNEKTRLACSSGLSIVGISNVFEIYIPLYENKILTNSPAYKNRKNILSRISFLLDFNNLRRKGREVAKLY